LRLGGVGKTPGTWCSRPPIMAALLADGRCAVREKGAVGGGEKRRGR
jgi:hypothetical protein